MNPEMKAIAERLKSHNLSEVARRAGMSYNNISRIVNGHKTDLYLSTANKLSRVMDEMELEFNPRSCNKCKVPFRVDKDHCGLCGERDHAAS